MSRASTPVDHASLAMWCSTTTRTCSSGATRSSRARNGTCTDRSNPCPASSATTPDRKSTRLNSSHDDISYAVFCLKKSTNFCPAHVYEMLPDGACGKTLQINASICRHCKACDIKEPYADQITLFFFKGGAPPNYHPLSPPFDLPV